MFKHKLFKVTLTVGLGVLITSNMYSINVVEADSNPYNTKGTFAYLDTHSQPSSNFYRLNDTYENAKGLFIFRPDWQSKPPVSFKEEDAYVAKLTQYQKLNTAKEINSNIIYTWSHKEAINTSKAIKKSKPRTDYDKKMQRTYTLSNYNNTRVRLGVKVYNIHGGKVYKKGVLVKERTPLITTTPLLKKNRYTNDLYIENGLIKDINGKSFTGSMLTTYFDSMYRYESYVYKGKIVFSGKVK